MREYTYICDGGPGVRIKSLAIGSQPHFPDAKCDAIFTSPATRLLPLSSSFYSPTTPSRTNTPATRTKLATMWDWDSIIEVFAGSSTASSPAISLQDPPLTTTTLPELARDLRAKQFRQDIRRAGIAQERRARSALTSGAVTNHRAGSPNSISATSPAASLLSARPAAPVYVMQPGSMRPRRVPFQHPAHHDVPVPLARPRIAADFINVPCSELPSPETAQSPRDSVAPSLARDPALSVVASPVPSHGSGAAARRGESKVREAKHVSFESGLREEGRGGCARAARVESRRVRIVSPEEAASAIASDSEDDDEDDA
ncbi:hypothetical protein LTR35_015624 [Friedmanniomyces endolithicus]|uniref:Uncharacterized protein n=1 Tax=Friedmanniomyces endolithicus TaxID=329885 RepID=A0AAN6FAI7_9PEZI|nr:hypothetical protein LTR35_015624 [Friedmanniomyces endolithicus]KAK0276139.1 hypothetical protein LTS00_014692 [Friedmanniomyces endolithicus]KAK0309058.1 hypothetical protein LTR82_015344 [Friedmanniomyces endolithicus]KAK0980491.1 hypothetical protein LTR54_015303 [Friedmanniomyces endolithicus]